MTPDAPDDTDQALAVDALMATSRVMAALVARTLATLDETVTMPQFRVLVMLQVEGSLNLKTIADGLGVNSSNASRTCEKLVGAGLISRGDAAHDRRNVSISLTSEGRRMVDSLMKERSDLLARAVAELRPQDQRQLVEALSAFLAAVESSGLGERIHTQHTAIFPWLK